MSLIPKPHEIYKHFKGNLYQITAIAEHTETGETLVVYQAMYGDFKTYARPLAMFMSLVDFEKYPDAEQEFRFELQGPEAERQRAERRSSRDMESGQDISMGGKALEPGQAVSADGEALKPGQAVSADGEALEPGQAVGTDGKALEPGQAVSADGEALKPGRAGADRAEENGFGEVREEDEELSIDPMVLEFLDADSYEQRLNILAGLHHRITDDMITTMAIACDVEINQGDVEERYEALKACLLTLERYECNRIR